MSEFKKIGARDKVINIGEDYVQPNSCPFCEANLDAATSIATQESDEEPESKPPVKLNPTLFVLTIAQLQGKTGTTAVGEVLSTPKLTT